MYFDISKNFAFVVVIVFGVIATNVPFTEVLESFNYQQHTKLSC